MFQRTSKNHKSDITKQTTYWSAHKTVTSIIANTSLTHNVRLLSDSYVYSEELQVKATGIKNKARQKTIAGCTRSSLLSCLYQVDVLQRLPRTNAVEYK